MTTPPGTPPPSGLMGAVGGQLSSWGWSGLGWAGYGVRNATDYSLSVMPLGMANWLQGSAASIGLRNWFRLTPYSENPGAASLDALTEARRADMEAQGATADLIGRIRVMSDEMSLNGMGQLEDLLNIPAKREELKQMIFENLIDPYTGGRPYCAESLDQLLEQVLDTFGPRIFESRIQELIRLNIYHTTNTLLQKVSSLDPQTLRTLITQHLESDPLYFKLLADHPSLDRVAEKDLPEDLLNYLEEMGQPRTVEGLAHLVADEEAKKALLIKFVWTPYSDQLLDLVFPNGGLDLQLPHDFFAELGWQTDANGMRYVRGLLFDLAKSQVPTLLSDHLPGVITAYVKPFEDDVAPEERLGDRILEERERVVESFGGKAYMAEFVHLIGDFVADFAEKAVDDYANNREARDRDINGEVTRAIREDYVVFPQPETGEDPLAELVDVALEQGFDQLNSVVSTARVSELTQVNLMKALGNLGERIDNFDPYFMENLTVGVMGEVSRYLRAIAKIDSEHGLELSKEELFSRLDANHHYILHASLQGEGLSEEERTQKMIEHFCTPYAQQLADLLLPNGHSDLEIPPDFYRELGVMPGNAAIEEKLRKILHKQLIDNVLPGLLATTVESTVRPHTLNTALVAAAKAMRFRNEYDDMVQEHSDALDHLVSNPDGLTQEELAAAIEELRTNQKLDRKEKLQELIGESIRTERLTVEECYREKLRNGRLTTMERNNLLGQLDLERHRLNETEARINANIENLSEEQRLNQLVLLEKSGEEAQNKLAEAKWENLPAVTKEKCERYGRSILGSTTSLMLSANDHHSLPTWLRWVLRPLVALAGLFGICDYAGKRIGQTTVMSMSRVPLKEWLNQVIKSSATGLHAGRWREDEFLPDNGSGIPASSEESSDSDENLTIDGEDEFFDAPVPNQRRFTNFEDLNPADRLRYEEAVRNSVIPELRDSLKGSFPDAPSTQLRRLHERTTSKVNRFIRHHFGETCYYLKFIADRVAGFVWQITVGRTFSSVREAVRDIFFHRPVDCMVDRMEFLARTVFNEQLVLRAFELGANHLQHGENNAACLGR